MKHSTSTNLQLCPEKRVQNPVEAPPIQPRILNPTPKRKWNTTQYLNWLQQQCQYPSVVDFFCPVNGHHDGWCKIVQGLQGKLQQVKEQQGNDHFCATLCVTPSWPAITLSVWFNRTFDIKRHARLFGVRVCGRLDRAPRAPCACPALAASMG